MPKPLPQRGEGVEAADVARPIDRVREECRTHAGVSAGAGSAASWAEATELRERVDVVAQVVD